ncbi:MAG: SbcC/MukB-like Walker B domain-containing protein, partial [Actinomycetota bacterium]
DEELAWARQTHAAHLLRVSLSPGEPCPVCKRPVEEIPPAGRAPGLREAESHREAAAREVRSAGARLGELDRAGAVGFERLEACRIDLVQAMQEMETAEEGLGRLLGFGVDAATEIARREEALSGLRSRTEEARARWEGLGERARRAAEEVEEVARRRRAVAGSLIRVCTRLEVEAPTTEEDAAGLAEAAKRAAGAGAVRASEGERRRRELQGQCSSERTVLEGLRSRLGLGPGESVEEALEQANREVWTLSHRMDELRDSIRIRAELLAKVEQAEAKASLYLRLKADLTDAKFIAYLLDEERRLLARLGSEKLFELTSRYRFDEEGEFQIVDTLHEVTRSPDTLSGGETFLASLALALALAEAVSQGGSRLEALFLDEGFGSLDPLSLDVALEGIENLAAPGRLIGLISHVPGIQARLDDLIVLDRAGDGTTVVIQAEGPIAYPAAGI